MFWNLYLNENTKNLRRWMLWAEILVLVVLVIFLNVGTYFLTQGASGSNANIQPDSKDALMQTLTWPTALPQMLGLAAANGLGGLLVIILTAAITAQEYTWRTMQLWISQGARRSSLMIAKFTSILLPVLLIVLTPVLVGGLLTIFFSFHINGSLNLEQIDFWQLFLGYLRTAYTLLPYAALTFLFAVLSRSTVVAIGAGLGYSLLLEGVFLQLMVLFGGGFGKFIQYLPGALTQSLLSLNQNIITSNAASSAGPTIELLAPFPAAAAIFVWTAALVGLATWRFHKQDLSG